MTEEDKEFLQHIWKVLKYDTSEGAPPIHEQFYERHKDIIEQKKSEYVPPEKPIPFDQLPIEEKRRKWREWNKKSRLARIKRWENRRR